MKIALDANVISALWSSENSAQMISSRLGDLRTEFNLVVAAPVFAELLAHPMVTERQAEEFLSKTHLLVDFAISEECWRVAGSRFADYAKRRRRSGGGEPKRFLVDFIIGAHALVECERLFTLDHARYTRDFPELALIWL